MRHNLARKILGQRQAVTKLYYKLNGWFPSCFGLAMTNPKLLTDGLWECSHMYIIAVHPHAQAVVQVCR